MAGDFAVGDKVVSVVAETRRDLRVALGIVKQVTPDGDDVVVEWGFVVMLAPAEEPATALEPAAALARIDAHELWKHFEAASKRMTALREGAQGDA